MKKIVAAFFFFSLLILINVYAQMPPEWPDQYVGVWQVEESDGSPRFIVLAKDGTGETTFNPKAHGKWQYDPDQEEVRVTWDDGWADVLVQEGRGFINYGYAPGADPDSGASNEGSAKKVKLNPFDFVGIWKITDLKGHESKLTINDNSTVQSDQKNLTKGKWTIDGQRIHIVWSNGRNDFLYQSGNQYKLITYLPGVSVDATLGVNADAERTVAFLRSDLQATEINEENFS